MTGWITGVIVLWPALVLGGSCSDFPWNVPRDMVMPAILQEAQGEWRAGGLLTARTLFETYLQESSEGSFHEPVRWATASLPDESDEPGSEFLGRIKRLQNLRTEEPNSVYGPWALCFMGELYWKAGWHSESKALFEEFLRTYPKHPLAGGVMVEAGLGYLENQQYLEAALILRRVVEEPKWDEHRLKGALGLADATAMSGAWKQARYWYKVVEAENPKLIRQSGRSAYHFGLAELAIGEPDRAVSHFLTTINLHPRHEVAGKGFNRIAQRLHEEGDDFLALWFADQAQQQFPNSEPGRRGKAHVTRWVVGFLSQGPSQADLENAYQRFNELNLYVSISWDGVLEAAEKLSHAPEIDLKEEGLSWMAEGYQYLGDQAAALRVLKRLIVESHSPRQKTHAQERLHDILVNRLQELTQDQAWVDLLKYHEQEREGFRLLPLDRTRIVLVAQAYQRVHLPMQALRWYDQLLKEYPDTPLREEILAKKVFGADAQGQTDVLRSSGKAYLREFPQGQWHNAIHIVLGKHFLNDKTYLASISHFSEVIQHSSALEMQRVALRNRARAYQALQMPESAGQDFRQAAALEPNNLVDVVRLADFLFEQGDYAEAEGLYEEILKTDPPGAVKTWATYRWGLSLEYRGKPQAAKKLLANVQQMETRSPEFENTIRAAASAVLEEFSSSSSRGALRTQGS